MAKKEKEVRIVTLEELKEILFKATADELEGYLYARSIMSEDMAERQRQRYVALFQVIATAELNEEYNRYKKELDKERHTHDE